MYFPNTSGGFNAPAIAATDLENDGKLDVVLGHSTTCFEGGCVATQMISVMRGNGDSTFQPARQITVGSGIARIAAGDFNRDGIKDLAIAGSQSRVYVLLGVGDGTFNQQTLTLADPNLHMSHTDIDVADLNGDTFEDLVAAMASNGSYTAILIGNGDGTFRQPALLIQEPNVNVPQKQAVADYNGDGFQDLALALGDGNTGLMEILNGNGDGTFQPRVLYLVPPPKSGIGGISIIAADFNGDSKPDIALGWAGASGGLAVLINTTGAPPPSTPSAPTLVSPVNAATVTLPVTLDWSDVTAAASYQIQIDDSSSFSAPRVVDQTVTASQFTIASLAARQHWRRVRGINSAGTAGAWSSVRSFTPQSAPVPGSNTGLRSPTANAADSGGDGNGFESSPASAHTDDALNAVDNNSGSGFSTSCTSTSKDSHAFSTYGFTFPAGVSIRGIEVRLDAKVDSTSSSPKMCVQLSWDGGTTWTSAKSTPTLGTSMGTSTLGSAADTWGRSWTTGNLSDANFRVRVINVSGSSSRDFSLDWVAVRVHYQ